MIGRRCLALLVPIGISIVAIGSFANRAHPGGVGVSRPAHPANIEGTQAVTTPFQFYRVPQEKSPRAWRDLEFLTSRTYENYARPLSGAYNGSDFTELDKLGITICEQLGTNPFGFPYTDLQMTYDYFARRATAHGNFRDSLYNPLASAPVGLRVWKPEWSNADRDRSHIDTYVYLPKFTNDGAFGSYEGDSGQVGYGLTPSLFFSEIEDSTTGKFGLHLDEWHHNSLQIPGPRPSQVGDPNPATHWARANALQSSGFNHEFTHSINYRAGGEGSALSEIFSSAAEQICGELPETPGYEVPYSWGLLRYSSNLTVHNYQAWRGFSAYLGNHFRGVDTTATGYRDHLLLRWAGKEPDQTSFARLADRLSAAECAECTLKTYLHGLSPVDRRELVVHNWRIAMFANRHGLAENQYGFVPHLGFDPVRDLGTWRGFVDSTESDDSVSVPHEAVLTPTHLTRDLSLAGSQADLGGQQTYRSTTLEPRGADYWVLRPDPSLGSARRTLVIRIAIELPCESRRLMASAILYREHLVGGQPDSLWKHPEWVRAVVGPHWVDIADGAGAVPELVIDDFGDSTKAVAVVVTLGESTPLADGGTGTPSALVRYRLRAGFRSGAYLSPNPTAIYPEATWEDWPAFSPAGDTLVFAVYDPEVSQRRIYRAPATGGTRSPLIQPPGSADEDHPDWSPRGDWVAFERAVSQSQCDLWAFNVRGLGLRQLTTSSLHDYAPSFSPNGQQVAYLRVSSGGGREVRSVGISGTGDALLVSRGIEDVVSPRWAPDGRHVYFVANDTLYSVAVSDRAVAARRFLGSDVRSFDLPLGLERLAVDRVLTDKFCAVTVPFCCHQTLRRTFLVDTLTDRDEMAFYRTRTRTTSPRWASSGTRLAFATNPLPADSCDIRIGQVSFNHAPLLHDVAQFYEMDVYAHVPFSYDFSASDSDGEAITFQGVYLPDSATFDPSSGLFSWPNPKQNGADDLYFIVFRALDPSGGVHSYVTRFRVLPQAPGGGGCPFVDVNTADGWITDNSILGRSRTGEPGLDAYRLKRSPDTRGNRIRLRIRENENELTTLDQVRLLAVDRAPTLTLLSAGGELHWGTRVPAWRVTTSKGEDITNLVTGAAGSLGWQGSPGDTVLVEMTDPATGRFGLTGTQDGGGGTGEGSDKEVEIVYDPTAGGGRYAASPAGGQSATPAALTDALWLDQTGIRVQVPDGTGSWQDLTHWYPREHNDEVYFPGLTQPQARLIFVGRHRLTFFGRLKPASGAVTQTPLSPLTATHTRLGDARDAVGVSETTTELAPGDTLKLEFEVPPPVEGLVREYFLVTRGVYTSDVPAARLRPQAPAAPSRYALLQNVPNPFAGTTAIQFELPRAERVKLEVFDLLGRRVRTLAEGEWPAGYHAVEWDRTSDAGTRLRAGVYLYRLTAGSFRDQKKMVIGAR